MVLVGDLAESLAHAVHVAEDALLHLLAAAAHLQQVAFVEAELAQHLLDLRVGRRGLRHRAAAGGRCAGCIGDLDDAVLQRVVGLGRLGPGCVLGADAAQLGADGLQLVEILFGGGFVAGRHLVGQRGEAGDVGARGADHGVAAVDLRRRLEGRGGLDLRSAGGRRGRGGACGLGRCGGRLAGDDVAQLLLQRGQTISGGLPGRVVLVRRALQAAFRQAQEFQDPVGARLAGALGLLLEAVEIVVDGLDLGVGRRRCLCPGTTVGSQKYKDRRDGGDGYPRSHFDPLASPCVSRRAMLTRPCGAEKRLRAKGGLLFGVTTVGEGGRAGPARPLTRFARRRSHTATAIPCQEEDPMPFRSLAAALVAAVTQCMSV